MCDADVDALETIMVRASSGPPAGHYTLAPRLVCQGGATRVTLSADATGDDLAQAIAKVPDAANVEVQIHLR